MKGKSTLRRCRVYVPYGSLAPTHHVFPSTLTLQCSIEGQEFYYSCVLIMISSVLGLWGLVNNAGIGNFMSMDLLMVETYEETAAANLFGAIDVTMTFLPLVKKALGRVVNVSSIAGRLAVPFIEPYSVSKYGLEAFSDGLRSVRNEHMDNT